MVYAHKQGISRRTLVRYARLGKVETKKRIGWTYVVDKPIKSTLDKTDLATPSEFSVKACSRHRTSVNREDLD
jgi:predicted site-specific integrase-resolvase